MMIVYKDCNIFTVMGKEILLYSENLESGRNTVAEIDSHYHYLGNECPTVGAAIFAWQEVNSRELTNEELRQVMLDNHLISQGI
jgi:hypothetical protein